MGNYKVRYGRTVNLGNYESCRIEIEEEFDDEMCPDRLTAVRQLARMVEPIAEKRRRDPMLEDK